MPRMPKNIFLAVLCCIVLAATTTCKDQLTEAKLSTENTLRSLALLQSVEMTTGENMLKTAEGDFAGLARVPKKVAPEETSPEQIKYSQRTEPLVVGVASPQLSSPAQHGDDEPWSLDMLHPVIIRKDNKYRVAKKKFTGMAQSSLKPLHKGEKRAKQNKGKSASGWK